MLPNRETKEKRQHSTALIPYSLYQCNLPKEFINVPMHWHSEFEIKYILEGKGNFICDNQKFTATKGDIIILLPNMLHSATPFENNILVYDALVFHSSMLGANSNDLCAIKYICPLINGNIKINALVPQEIENYDTLKATISQIFFCAHSSLCKMDLLLKSELMKLFWLLEDNQTIIYHHNNQISYHEIIRPVLEYMTNNFQEDIRIEQLANLVHLSKSYFMNCFKKAVGITAIEHLEQLRVNAACKALSNTEKRISDIAFSCGYHNLSNFNRQFLKMVGQSPNKYRRQIGQGEIQ